MLSFLLRKLVFVIWNKGEEKSKNKKVKALIQKDLLKLQEKYGTQYQTVFFGYNQSVLFSKSMNILIVFLSVISLLLLVSGLGVLLIFTVPFIILFSLLKNVLKKKVGVLLYSPEKMHLVKGKNEVSFHLGQVQKLELNMSKGLVFDMGNKEKQFLTCGGHGYVEFLDMLEQEFPHLIMTIPDPKYKQHKYDMVYLQKQLIAVNE